MDQTVLLKTNPSLRNSLRLIVLPLLVTPGAIFLATQIFDEFPFFPGMLIMIVVGLIFPFWAWLITKFHSYSVTNSTVLSRKGLLSKYSNEIRIRDIRAINIRQSLMKRILRIGDVAFSSSAGDQEEVVFLGVSHPERVNKIVKERMAIEGGRRDETPDNAARKKIDAADD